MAYSKEEKASYNKAYREKNREKIRLNTRKRYARKTKEERILSRGKKEDPIKARARAKAWREANIEKVRAYVKAKYQANKENEKEKSSEWQKNNSEKANARKNDWAKTNPDKRKKSVRKWREANPGKIRAFSQRRRALKCGATVGKFLPIEIFERDAWKCQLCHRKVNKKLKHPNPFSPSLDHIIPLSRGGAHSRANTQLAHLCCNVAANVNGVK